MNRSSRGRANGEGSIFPYRNGYAAYVWVTTPTGEEAAQVGLRETREQVHDKWVQLEARADTVPIPTTTPTVTEYLNCWLEEVMKPNREVGTYPPMNCLIACMSFTVSARRG